MDRRTSQNQTTDLWVMRSRPSSMAVWLWLLGVFAPYVWAEFVEPPPSYSLRSMAESPTRLPCRFRVQEEQLVQVSWTKEHPDGNKEQIITAHRTEGHTEFGRFSGRVNFESSDPMENSALIIRSTEVSDEGRYTCHISTFPSGNFDTQLSLTVWTTPISSLEPVEMVEGQSFRVAATCRSVARPPPRLSWETELPGVAQNRSSEGGAVSTHFSLHPLRSMNGKRLDCLVWHPSMETPRRLSNQLVVHYPPDAAVRGYDGNWFVGLEGASLRCDSGGNPKPQSFTWTRRGGALPEGVTQRNDTLLFSRPLTLTDAGLYECVAKNSVGLAKADVDIAVAETTRQEASFSTLMMLIVGVVAAVLVVALVISVIMMNRYHKRRNKKLEMELSEKKEEISTLSRQASFRRINSVSTDHRMQMEESVPLRVEGTLRTSLSSLGEQARCRDSRSTLSGGRGGGGGMAVDSLGRPALYNTSRRGERGREREMEREGERAESRQRVESYVLSSGLALDPPLLPPLLPALPPGARNHHPPFSRTSPPLSAEEEEEEEREMERQSDREKEGVQGDQDSETTSSQISEVLSSRFQQSNGTLHPKPRLNDILLPPQIYHPKGQIV
ncbi:nectin-4 isoform X2 [Megalops cyprinoides]|uniref:nectin-4 isoform X2 n=1 Tax=Megalops cyprinoides TaxID=118141 RepID=UPI0018642073|nr:nectin-4 isoform X2 [Megalops cyprinoides]